VLNLEVGDVMNTKIYTGSGIIIALSCPLRFALGGTPGDNHYFLSMHDVPSVGPDAPSARGYMSGHHLTSNPLKYKCPSGCHSQLLSHYTLSAYNYRVGHHEA
jgi:hypothetical protein